MPRTTAKKSKNNRVDVAPYTRPSTTTQPVVASSEASTLNASSPQQDDGEARHLSRRRLVTEDITTKSGRGRKTKSHDKQLARILQLAQFIKRNVDLWVYVPQAMNVGMAYDTIERCKGKDLRPEDPTFDELKDARLIVKNCGSNKDALLGASNGIKVLLAEQWDYICELTDDEEEELWKQVNYYADQGRSNDTATIKGKGNKYVMKDGYPKPLLDEHEPKAIHRGLNHPDLLRLLIPMSILHKHSSEPQFEDDVMEKKYKIDNNSLPALLFDVEAYNPVRPTETLLQGHLPVRVLRHIFTCPSSANKGPGRKRSTRPSNAEIAGIKEVTPEMIAYACVQARHLISSQEFWGEHDESFSNKTFYYQILSLFNKKRTADWVEKTLAWWNERVFGAREEDENVDTGPDPNDETAFQNLLLSIADGIEYAEDEQDEASSPAPAAAAAVNASQTQFDSQYSINAFANFDFD